MARQSADKGTGRESDPGAKLEVSSSSEGTATSKIIEKVTRQEASLPRKATRDGYGEAILILGEKNPQVVVLDADTASSTRSGVFAKKFPERFFNVGVSEHDLIGVAAGLASSGKIPFATAYSIFITGKAWDQIRHSVCYSNLNVKIVGSHAGLVTGPDGATHQALEDIALLRCLPRMKIIVPCDAIEAKKATLQAAEIYGPVYLRLIREPLPILTTEESPFQIGKGEIFRQGKDVAIIACGTMVWESLQAAEILSKEGIQARVINLHTIKPIDKEKIVQAAKECGVIVTAEEHQLYGGLGSAVAEVVVKEHPVPMEMIGVNDRFGESGEAEELLRNYGLKAANIASACKFVLKRKK